MSHKKSRMDMWHDADGLHFTGLVSQFDFPELDAFDRAMVESCDKEDAPASHWLLALECIFRRMEEQKARDA